mmetsp:Transcript_57828/g.113837  ORF Transcript_57828/g.113837 Transcript_57828/m.113837 type:complete len:171 (-) Transcript_57828:726-1238(-)
MLSARKTPSHVGRSKPSASTLAFERIIGDAALAEERETDFWARCSTASLAFAFIRPSTMRQSNALICNSALCSNRERSLVRLKEMIFLRLCRSTKSCTMSALNAYSRLADSSVFMQCAATIITLPGGKMGLVEDHERKWVLHFSCSNFEIFYRGIGGKHQELVMLATGFI